MRPLNPRVRRWLVGLAIACLALELVYVVAGRVLLRGDTLERLINKKPEKFRIEFTGARSWLPGVVSVDTLTLHGQSRGVQWYLAADEVRGRLSLWRLVRKTVHVRAAHTAGLDFRLRKRLDPPPVVGEDGVARPRQVTGARHFPDIPGFSNPPEPAPEALYPPPKVLKKPWVIDLGGVEVDGPVNVAVNRARIEGAGEVSGAMVFRTRESIEVRRGNLRWGEARVLIDSEVAIDDLALDVASRWRPFPAKGAKLPQILGGISGRVAIAGTMRTAAAVPLELVPGLPVEATGRLETTLHLEDGALLPGSTYSLTSDDLSVGLLGLKAAGTARLTAATGAGTERPQTDLAIDLESFALFDPADAAVGVRGAGLAVRASWEGLSLADFRPATAVEVTVPPTEISDVGVFGALLPPPWGLDLTSGTGTVSARLAVDAERVASGRFDLESQQVRLKTRGTPVRADLAVHAELARGDLKERRFEMPEATIAIANAAADVPGEQRKGGPWWCSLKLERASVTLGTPIAAAGSLAVKMRDTRPIMRLIDELSDPPAWFALVPEVENVDGTMTFAADGAASVVRDVTLTGESLEILGWLRLADKKADGRVYAKYGILAAGVGIDAGKSSVHVVRPRRWFDAQPSGPAEP
jgi:hypothetical protein